MLQQRRNRPKAQCYATQGADPPCTGWHEEGWPFHGCKYTDPDHVRRGPWNQRKHRCKCGHEWRSHPRRERGDD